MNHYADLKQGVAPEQSQYILRPEDFQQLMQWMQQFAYQRGIPFDPMAAGSGAQPMGPNGQPMGPEQNVVYKDPSKNVVEIDGSATQIDVWGNDNEINFPPPWQATAEVSTAGEPPSKVIKIIGTDSSQKGPDGQPLKVVVYIHEPDGTKNTVNTWKKGNGEFSFQDNTGGLVTTGEYKGPSGAGEKLPLNPDHPEDTIPDEVDEDAKTATYNTSHDVNLTPNFDDEITTHESWVPGTQVIHAGNLQNTAYVAEYDEDTYTWTIYVYQAGTGLAEKFIIHGGPDTKVVLDVMGENSLVNDADDPVLESVQIGLEGADGTEGASGSESGIIKGLLDETGKTEAQLLNALKSAGYSYESIKDFEKAIKEGKFPPPDGPNSELINFLYILDPKFADKAHEAISGETIEAEGAMKRIIELLQTLYPDENLSLATAQHPYGFTVGDKKYILDFQVFYHEGEFILHETDAWVYEMELQE
jgi:hypothetical protein